MAKQLSHLDRLDLRMRRYPSHERLLLMRNVSYGGAAICLAVLAGLTQVGAKTEALQVSVFGAAVAMPFWLLVGAAYEFYIFLGKQSYGHFRSKLATNFLGGGMAIAGLGTICMTGGIIWFLIPEAAYAFGVASVVALVAAFAFQAHLARWWHRERGPGHVENSDEA